MNSQAHNVNTNESLIYLVLFIASSKGLAKPEKNIDELHGDNFSHCQINI